MPNFAYVVSNQTPGHLVVCELASPFTTTSITVGNGPKFCAMSPDGSQVWVTNTAANTISVVSTASNTVTATIAGFNRPEGIGFNLAGTTVWVYNIGTNRLIPVDVATQVLGTPIALTNNLDTQNLVGSQIAMNPKTNSLAAEELTGVGASRAFQQVAIPLGTLSPILLPAAGTNAGIGYDGGGVFMYWLDRAGGVIGVYSVSGNNFVKNLVATQAPQGSVAGTPDGTVVYVSETGTPINVDVITVSTNTITSNFTVPVTSGDSLGSAVTGDGTQYVVSAFTSGTADVYTVPANTHVHQFSVAAAYGVCTTPLPIAEQIVMIV